MLPCGKKPEKSAIRARRQNQYSDVEILFQLGQPCREIVLTAANAHRLLKSVKHPVSELLLRSALSWHGQSKLRIQVPCVQKWAESATMRADCFNCHETLSSCRLVC